MFRRIDKGIVVLTVLLTLVLAAAVAISAWFLIPQSTVHHAESNYFGGRYVYFNRTANERLGFPENSHVFFDPVGSNVGEVANGDVVLLTLQGANIRYVGIVQSTNAGTSMVTVDILGAGAREVSISEIFGVYTEHNQVLGQITYWTALTAHDINGDTTPHAYIWFIIMGLLAVIIIYEFIAAAAAIHRNMKERAAAMSVAGAREEDAMPYYDNDEVEYADNTAYADTGNSSETYTEEYYTGEEYYDGGDYYGGEELPVDDAMGGNYMLADSLSATGSMEAFVYAELRKRELEVDGERKKREIELDAERKKREMELDSEKKQREMELELEKKRLEIEREVKLRKIESDREIARANAETERVKAMAAMYNPFFANMPQFHQPQQQQQQADPAQYAQPQPQVIEKTVVVEKGHDVDWEAEKEADRQRDERFRKEQEEKEAMLSAEREKIASEMRAKQEEMERRTAEAEEARRMAERAAEIAEKAAVTAAAAAEKGGGGANKDDVFEVNNITNDLLQGMEIISVPGLEDLKVPKAVTFDYTVEDIYQYALAKKGATVKDGVGKKPTTFRSGSKSFLLLYRLDGHIKLTLKCGPSYANKLKEFYPEIELSRFPYGLIWFAIEPADEIGFEVIKTLIDVSYEISLRNY